MKERGRARKRETKKKRRKERKKERKREGKRERKRKRERRRGREREKERRVPATLSRGSEGSNGGEQQAPSVEGRRWRGGGTTGEFGATVDSISLVRARSPFSYACQSTSEQLRSSSETLSVRGRRSFRGRASVLRSLSRFCCSVRESIYVYIYIYIYTHTHTHIYIYIYIYIYIIIITRKEGEAKKIAIFFFFIFFFAEENVKEDAPGARLPARHESGEPLPTILRTEDDASSIVTREGSATRDSSCRESEYRRSLFFSFPPLSPSLPPSLPSSLSSLPPPSRPSFSRKPRGRESS